MSGRTVHSRALALCDAKMLWYARLRWEYSFLEGYRETYSLAINHSRHTVIDLALSMSGKIVYLLARRAVNGAQSTCILV